MRILLLSLTIFANARLLWFVLQVSEAVSGFAAGTTATLRRDVTLMGSRLLQPPGKWLLFYLLRPQLLLRVFFCCSPRALLALPLPSRAQVLRLLMLVLQ